MVRKQILCIDGGGTGGIFMHTIISKIQNEHSPTIDMIVGVSAGAIIGALLATQQIESLSNTTIERYTKLMFDIKHVNGPWLGPKYDGHTKTAILQEIFGHARMRDVRIPFAVILDIVDDKPHIITSWEHPDMLLFEILDATSAVPILFPPVTINNHQYIDGGSVTNSPISVGCLLAYEYFSLVSLDDIWIMSVGLRCTDMKKSMFENHEMGLVQLVSMGMISKLMEQRSYLENLIISRILGKRYMRIECSSLGRLDDTTVQQEYIQLGNDTWDRLKVDICDYLEY